ncbi:glycosyltransferase family 4 protein [Nocardioides baculatus]|uniref:Glycosyltransferase family 4 protein n=1 Tax=Nocardioides baculatus TaxID=2801337 RepID=A0ABS1LC50_9ACTN|nr:glycosyltransferase family 4 protein [Nocardioides baculatus]MBL0749117.1 glycosyltransferase family 4 protein [Nocardioides baculatus]
MAERIHLAANNADLGGGEQMLVRAAAALLDLGHDVAVVAPDSPTEVLDAAAGLGAVPVAIRADGRKQYMRRLRSWDRTQRRGLLWCHGLVPALATAGHRRRIVHLHQLPRSRAQTGALVAAGIGSERLLVPSQFLARQLGGAQPFANWTDDAPRRSGHDRARRVGFLGRLSTIKGLDVLAEALAQRGLDDVDLVVAGDERWVPDTDARPVREALAALGDRVSLLGRVDSPDAFFDQVDLAVIPSRIAESFGLVVAEAMAAGVPFVVSDAGALPEVAGPAHPWVARSGDPHDLARTLRDALSADTEQVRTVTDAARKRWEDEYSPAAGRERVRRLLEELGV